MTRVLIDFGKERNKAWATIARNTKTLGIQLLDLFEWFRGPKASRIRAAQWAAMPPNRRSLCLRAKNILSSYSLFEEELSSSRVNPFTEFESGKVPLYFGIGGGSQMLCKGLPFDVLAMIFSAEKMRRELGLKHCYIILANRITYTNIGKTSEFTKENIDRVLKGEKDLLEIVLAKCGMEDWSIFMISLELILSETPEKIQPPAPPPCRQAALPRRKIAFTFFDFARANFFF